LKLNAGPARQTAVNEARLRREAKALGAIRNDGVVDVVDAGKCDTSGFFLAMEKLEGRTLDGLLAARRKLAIPEALWIAKAAGTALVHAHARGVVHRDIKPANIFVTVGGDEPERIVLIDFGLAGYDSQQDPASSKLTGPGDLLGTLEYIAPEQLSHPEARDPRSDLYSLAVVLYECLTGALPTLADRVASPPRIVDVATACPGLSPAVAKAITKALQPRAQDRFERVADFLEALEAEQTIAPTVLLFPTSRGEAVATAAPPTRVEVRRTPGDVVGRRKHPRAPYITPCRILFANGTHIDGRSEDISVGGLLVVLSAAEPSKGPPPSGSAKAEEPVDVRFALPTTGAIVTVRGTVRWIVDGRGRSALGLAFVEPDEAIKSAISLYVGIVGQPPAR
jgi:serine/threonine protein kinase